MAHGLVVFDLDGTLVDSSTDLAGSVNAMLAELAPGVPVLPLPVVRGCSLGRDDLIRREVIMQLLCNLVLSKHEVSIRHGLDFDTYFASELTLLAPLIADGLCAWEDDILRILPPGQLLLRTVAAVFDATLHRPAPRHHAAAV